jgi:DNA polymerase III delta' subunit
MAFKDIAGNSRVKKILKLALERDRVPNSLLLCGPEGIGKRQMALTLAKALNCLEMAGDSCDRCPSCRAIDEGRFPDVMEMETQPGKQALAIEQTRLLKQAAYLRPMVGKKRVFILVDAEEMSADAGNSLLKVLEEPPLFSHIVLVTSRPFLLFPTIISRCQTLTFSAVSKEEIEEILVDHDYPEDQARILSLLVDGNLERALDLEWEDVQTLKDESWQLFEAMLSGRRASLFLERFGQLTKSSQEDFEKTLELFSSFTRDLLLLGLGADVRLLLNPDYEAELRKAAGKLSPRQVLALIAEIGFVLSSLPRRLNKNLLAATFFSNFGELSHV